MQMDLSFVEPGFHFAQIEVDESQDKRMIGKSQHGEGFQKQLSIAPLVTGSVLLVTFLVVVGQGWNHFKEIWCFLLFVESYAP